MKSLALSFALAFITFLPLSALAAQNEPADIVGTILEVEGLATLASQANAPVPARVNMSVQRNDLITTGPRARVYLQLIDNTELTLGENGQLTIDEYVFNDKDTSENKAAYSILKGAFLYVSGLVAKKQNPDVTVNIPYGSIGIRGTKFWGGLTNDEYGVIVGEGTVEVQTSGGKTRLSKGQGTTLKSKTLAPTPPKTWPKEKIDEAVKTVTLKAPAIVGQRLQQNAERNEFLRERHREIIHERKIEERKSEGLDEKIIETPDETNTDNNDDAARERLKRLREEKAQRLNNAAQSTTDDGTRETKSVIETPTTDTKSSISGGNVIRATPLRGAVETTTTITESTTDTGSSVVEKTTETVTETVKDTNDTVKSTTETLRETVETKTETATEKPETTTNTTRKPVETNTQTIRTPVNRRVQTQE